ncbi:lasso peptide biosynthesis PqqD family chaperone [Lentzea sp. HUAS TT2]|uniref:lasso peptide biosynthesis PqqD family chaperone n=1 Tax=Lentzea sp. HUAS TT2 TaxID=3447454 RepID=UPI003F711218
MTLRLRDGLALADTDYGVVLLDENTGQYWELNPTGAKALRSMVEGATPAEAAQDITRLYDIDLDTATQDISDLVGELHAAGLAQGGSR